MGIPPRDLLTVERIEVRTSPVEAINGSLVVCFIQSDVVLVSYIVILTAYFEWRQSDSPFFSEMVRTLLDEVLVERVELN